MSAEPEKTIDDVRATIRHVRDPLRAKSENWQDTADQWIVEFRHDNGFFTVDYYTGSGHRQKLESYHDGRTKAVTPKIKDVVYSLYIDSMSADQNFHEWCSDCGYSDDSIKALNIYKECLGQAVKLRKLGLSREYLAKEFDGY